MFSAFYNHRVTGEAVRLPYTLYERQHKVVPLFLFQGLRTTPPTVQVDAFQRWNNEAVVEFRDKQRRGWRTFAESAFFYLSDFFPVLNLAMRPGLTFRDMVKRLPMIALQLPLFLAPWLLLRGRLRLVTVVFLGFLAAISVTSWNWLHYAGPIYPAVILLTVLSVRRAVRWVGTPGRAARWSLGPLLALQFVFWPVLLALPDPIRPGDFGHNRAQCQQQLEALGGKHLVLVRYDPDHVLHDEWVYNGPDLRSSQVVWARDLGEPSNRELLAHLPERRVWRISPDVSPRELVEFRLPRMAGYDVVTTRTINVEDK